jgi:competence protein ComEA
VPTPNERKALWFLAIVALSGSVVRLMRPSQPPPTSAQAQALERQLRRVDSARAAKHGDQKRRSFPQPPAIVDLDRASVEQIEALPGIGPALAKRIVAHRDSVGTFGAIEALCEVRGVGPKLAERLRPLVTFTAPRRPLNDACGGSARVSRKRRGS